MKVNGSNAKNKLKLEAIVKLTHKIEYVLFANAFFRFVSNNELGTVQECVMLYFWFKSITYIWVTFCIRLMNAHVVPVHVTKIYNQKCLQTATERETCYFNGKKADHLLQSVVPL